MQDDVGDLRPDAGRRVDVGDAAGPLPSGLSDAVRSDCWRQGSPRFLQFVSGIGEARDGADLSLVNGPAAAVVVAVGVLVGEAAAWLGAADGEIGAAVTEPPQASSVVATRIAARRSRDTKKLPDPSVTLAFMAHPPSRLPD